MALKATWVCDACGAEHDDPQSPERPRDHAYVWPVPGRWAKVAIGTQPSRNIDEQWESMHLCPDCVDQLYALVHPAKEDPID